MGDFTAHFAEGYLTSGETTRGGRVQMMLTRVGVSVLSGAVSTLGATAFLFFPVILFFRKFGMFIFATILSSLFISLFFFTALLASGVGPRGNSGDIKHMYRAAKRKLGLATKEE